MRSELVGPVLRSAPLIVHLVNDFPHGANFVLTLVDVEVHGNTEEQHFHTVPAFHRRVIPMPVQLTREAFLRITNTFEFCRMVEYNHQRWFAQQHAPIVVTNGDYLKLSVPPPEKCSTDTQVMLNDSQRMSIEDFWGEYYVPTSPDEETEESSVNVSPSLIDSEDIKREFGPHDSEDEDDLSQLQVLSDASSFMQQSSTEPASSSQAAPSVNLSDQVAAIVNDSCLLAIDIENLRPWPHWFRALSTAFWDTTAIENEDEGPVAYFDTWFADCRTVSATEVSLDLRLDSHMNLWQHDIQHLWRDKITQGVPAYIKWVVPTPPRSPLSRSSGHLLIFEDHRPFIRELHAVWISQSVRGPAGLENILEVTTWYLDAQYVPYNDASRLALLGDDFFEGSANSMNFGPILQMPV